MPFTNYGTGDDEDLYYAILGLTTGPGSDPQFDALPLSSQALHIAAIFEMEILNGGLCQFFMNCRSDYIPRVSASLREIGMFPMADLYEAFLSEHQINPEEFDSLPRDNHQVYIDQCNRYPFDAFNKTFEKLWESLNFENAMVQYANKHLEAFPLKQAEPGASDT